MELSRLHQSLPDLVYHLSTEAHDVSDLLDEERCLTTSFKAPRLQTFCSGRYCAHQVLEKLSVSSMPILIGSKKEPLFPETVRGSISHKDRIAVAVGGLKDHFQSVSIDVEVWDACKPHLWDYLFVEDEKDFLSGFSSDEAVIVATKLFSAKECFYKLQYPLTRSWLGFHDVQVLLDESQAQFQVQILKDNFSFDYSAEGYFYQQDCYQFSVMVIRT